MFTQEKRINDAKFFWNLAQVKDVIILQNSDQIKGKIVDKVEANGSHNLLLEVDQQLMDVLVFDKKGTPWQGFAIYKKS